MRSVTSHAAQPEFAAHPEFQGLIAEGVRARYDSEIDADNAWRRATTRLASTTVATALALAVTAAEPGRALGLGHNNWSAGQFAAQVERLVEDDRNVDLSTQIISYRTLVAGWDGVDSIAPPPSAIDDALAMIDKLPLGANPPEPMVAADGEVGFYWKTADGFIDIGFKGDGTISYYARAKDKVAKGVKPYDKDHPLPLDLLGVIEII